MKIAICDDQILELDNLTKLVQEYASDKCLDVAVVRFSHPDQLLSVCEQEAFDIYVLDIVMPMIDGISLGREIRRLNREAQIMYATTEPQFALDAFAANPINYLVKPVSKEKLYATLDLATARVDQSNEQTIAIKTADGLRVVRLSDIVYCEYQNHTILYALLDGNVVRSRTVNGRFIDNLEPLMYARCFIQPHASYFVNMNRIDKFAKDSFMMRGGARIPIAAKHYTAVRDTYMDYLMAKEGKR